MGIKALVVRKLEDGNTVAEVGEIALSDLPEGDVIVDVGFSTVNYKDGLCIGPGGGLVRNYPHVPGIDFSGTVSSSENPNILEGDKVVLTGWRVGEVRWGGYAQKARVKADWLVKLPSVISTRSAMAVGTAGFTAMLAIDSLELHGLSPGNGPVLVTGASGGVGSISTAILANLGYEVAAVTGRPEAGDYLKSLGATQIVGREEISETIKRPLERESWSGCVDAVGGPMLARILGQMKYGASVAAVGLAGGASLPASVVPFLLRGINLLGIDSVMQPLSTREKIWKRIASELPLDKLEEATTVMTMYDLPKLGKDILRGQVKGRVVIDVNA